MIDREARNKLAEELAEKLAKLPDRGIDSGPSYQWKVPKSKDRTVRTIYDQLCQDIAMRLPAKPKEIMNELPPALERSIERSIMFLQSDLDCKEESYWLDTIVNTVFWSCLAVACFCLPLIGAVELGWLAIPKETLSAAMICGFGIAFGMLFVCHILGLMLCAIHIIRVRIFRQDLTAYQETEDECWPFQTRDQYEAVRMTV